MAEQHDGDALPPDSPGDRLLIFRLDGELHAIRVADVGGVADCESMRELPGSPTGVLGLAEWRGSVLTVLDLPRLLGCAAPEEPACLIRLGAPLDQTALFLPATVQLTESRLERRSGEEIDGADAAWLCGGEPVRLVDPLEIVRSVEAKMRARG